MIDNVNIGRGQPLDVRRGSTTAPSNATRAEFDKPVPAASSALSGAIEHMVQQGMPIDLNHIVAVRNAIADGQYPVDPAKIAEKIIEFDQPSAL